MGLSPLPLPFVPPGREVGIGGNFHGRNHAMKKLLAVASFSLILATSMAESTSAWCNQHGGCQESYSFNFCNWPCGCPPCGASGNMGCCMGCGLPYLAMPPLPLPVSHSVLASAPPSDWAPYARVSYPAFSRTPEYGYDPGLVPPPLPPVSITTPGPARPNPPPGAPAPAKVRKPGWWNEAFPPRSPCAANACPPADACTCCDSGTGCSDVTVICEPAGKKK